jgi:drug/metabolite transporter (DMT)-like permease
MATVRASPGPSLGGNEMIAERLAARSPRMAGILLATGAYFLFSGQDAAVKWLATDYAIPLLLFMRSITIVLLVLIIGRKPLVEQVLVSRNKLALLMRGAIILAAWLCYYTASRHLQLAEMVTIYFAAPMMITVLSVFLLHEKVGWQRWAGTSLGFVGVVVACAPGGVHFGWPVALVLAAALLWAYSNILVRQISRTETTIVQMLFSNGAFVIACGAMLPWIWSVPSWQAIGLMAFVGLAGAGGQYLLFEGFRLAPASLVAPFEYSSLLWAFALSYIVWGDIPQHGVFLGAGIIIASGLLVVFGEWLEGKRSAVRLRPQPSQGK